MPCRNGKGKGKGKALPDHSLHLPDVDTILPLETALQSLASQQPAAVKAVYLHWCKKRQFSERPLLQRLWYEPPWHRLTVAGKPFYPQQLVDLLVVVSSVLQHCSWRLQESSAWLA